MRTLKIDTDRTDLRSTGVVSPVPLWVELSDGSRRPDPNGRQAIDEQGRPRWVVELVAPADEKDERDATTVVKVEIASHDRPDAGPFGAAVKLDDLAMSSPYVRKDGKLSAPMWFAAGIRGRQAQHQGQPKAA